MTDDEILQRLRATRDTTSLIAAIELLPKLKQPLTQFQGIRYLHREFPEFGLAAWKEASVSRHIIGPRGHSDEKVLENLRIALAARQGH